MLTALVLCRTQEEFSERLRMALAQEPHPMSAEERRRLTWEDATERFLDAAELKSGERPKPIEEACDRLAWKAFNAVSGQPLPCLSTQGFRSCLVVLCTRLMENSPTSLWKDALWKHWL